MTEENRLWIESAAEIIEESAISLKDSNTIDGSWQIKDQDILLEYVGLLELVLKLREISNG